MAAKTILLVDDSPTHLNNLRDAVAGTDARIVTATNGKEAVERTLAEKPDLVLMDIVMDGLDGYGACREIVRNEATRHTPVVFVTTKDQRADKMWGERQGGKGFITKPFQKQEVLDQVQRYC